MSVSSATTTDTTESIPSYWMILTCQDVTAMVTTKSGSRYTIVARPGRVHLIADDLDWARKGRRLTFTSSGGLLLLDESDRLLARTTRLVDVYIASN